MNTGYFEHLSQPYATILSSAWLFAMYVLTINTTMIFVYRHNVLCRQTPMKMGRFAKIYAFLVVYVGIQGVMGWYATEHDVNAHGYMEMIRENRLFAEDTPTATIYDTVSGLMEES
jgi:hypothetical protein